MPYIFSYILSFVLGVSIGSFLNVCVWRTRENISIVRGGSMCPNCRHKIHWYENIPLFSFLILLGGRCAYCRHKISWQYPIVELITGLLFVFIAWWHIGDGVFLTVEMAREWMIVSALIFIFLYDIKYQEILDIPTLYLLVLLFIFAIPLGWQTWESMIFGAIIGGGFFFAQYILSKGKWVGGGDIRLGILMGVILGWPNILLGFILSYVIGAVMSLILIASKFYKMKDATPFGTYLTIATFITMFWGEKVVSWYLGLL